MMSTGAMLNVIIAFLLTPVVTRLYSKEEFGIYYIYVSIVGISTMIVSGMYPHALVVPKFRKDFLALLKFCILSTIGGSIIFGLFLLFFGDWFFTIIGGEKLLEYWLVLPFGILISGLNVIFINWNVRRKEFKRNVISNISLSGSMKITQISYASAISGLFPGLILADILSKTISTSILGVRNILRDVGKFSLISFDNIKSVLFEYVKYPKFILTSNFVNKFTDDIPLFLISASFGAETVGAFGFARSMMAIPYSVLGSSITPVYFQRANELYNSNFTELQKFTKSTYLKMLVLASLAYGFIFAFGDILFKYVFSAEWEEAGNIASVFSIYFIVKIISSPFGKIFLVLRKEHYTLYLTSILAVSRVLGVFLGLQTGSLDNVILFFAIGNLIGYGCTNFQVFRALNINYVKQISLTIAVIVTIFSLFYLARYFINIYFQI